MQFFEKVLPFVRQFPEVVVFPPGKIASLLNDKNTTVRKQTVVALSAYMTHHPESHEVRDTWITGVLGSVIDVEQQVIDRALLEIESRVFKPLIAFSKRGGKFCERELVNGKFVAVVEQEELVPKDFVEDDDELGAEVLLQKRRKSSAEGAAAGAEEEEGSSASASGSSPSGKGGLLRGAKRRNRKTNSAGVGAKASSAAGAKKKVTFFEGDVFRLLESLDTEAYEYLQRALTLYRKQTLKKKEPKKYRELVAALGKILKIVAEPIGGRSHSMDPKAWPVGVWVLLDEACSSQGVDHEEEDSIVRFLPK